MGKKKELYPSWENVPRLLEDLAGGLVFGGIVVGLGAAALICGIVWLVMR